MKKSLFSTLFGLFLGFSAIGQISKGDLMIGGDGSLQFQDEFTQITFNPRVGFFLADKFALGAGLGLQLNSSGGASATVLTAGPFARYYFTNGSPAKFFGQGGVDFGTFRFDGESSGFNQFGLGAGASIFLNKSIALDAMLGFISAGSEDGGDRANQFGLTFGIQAFLSRGGDN